MASITSSDTNFAHIKITANTEAAVKNLHEFAPTIKKLLILLSKKEKYILEHRFGLKRNRETLEKIGNYFQITRERVRQIEQNALHKLQRHSTYTNLNAINQLAQSILKNHGGVMLENKLIENITSFTKIEKNSINSSYICLSLSLDQNLRKSFNTIDFYPYWSLKTITHEEIQKIANTIVSELDTHQKLKDLENFTAKINKKIFPGNELQKSLVKAIFELDKKFILIDNKIGLKSWRAINPRTIKDKICYILHERRTPLHFLEICNLIETKNFDHKKINSQAVHNELIRNPEFILIGRGIYALKEWGYQEGTVKDIIRSILKKHRSLSQEKILEEVLRQRRVKKITVLLNLKNKPDFERIGRKVYRLKK